MLTTPMVSTLGLNSGIFSASEGGVPASLAAASAICARKGCAAGSDDNRVESMHGSKLRLPRFVAIGGFAHRPREDAFFGYDNEERQVNRINAFAQNSALSASLALRFEEADGVLEMIGIYGATKRLNRLERNTSRA